MTTVGAFGSTTKPAIPYKQARDLDARELRYVIQEGVYYGVMKALAVYAIISLAVAVFVYAIAQAD